MVLDDIKVVQERAKLIGLSLNLHKCEVLSFDSNAADVFRLDAPDLKVVQLEDFCLLEVPISNEAITGHITSKISSVDNARALLLLLPSQDALFLMRYALSLPRLMYSLRTSPCIIANTLLATYDTLIREMLSSTLNLHFSDLQWRQVGLPVKIWKTEGS